MKSLVNENKTTLFTAAFGSLYFLLLVLTENFYSLWITPLFLLLYGFALVSLFNPKATKVDKRQFVLSCVFAGLLFLLFVLTPFGLKVPLGVYRWITLATAGVAMIFFFSTPILSKINHSTFLKVLVLIHALFIPLNIAVFFSSSLQTFTPLVSLFNFAEGQNHVYILYLLSLPLALEFSRQSKRSWMWLVLSLLFSAGVLLSFSRVGIFLLLMELIYFFRLHLQSVSHLVKRTIIALASVVALFGAAFLIFSLLPQFSFGDNCPLPFLQKQICKSFSADHRLGYWKQAIEGFKAEPLLGNGGGSFGNVSLSYRSQQSAYSLYPHNEYLQLIVEYGVIGWLFVAGYLAAIVYGWKHKAKLSPATQLLLFIVSICAVDSFFNYNWNFPGILLAEMLIWILYLSQLFAECFTSPAQKVPLRLVYIPMGLVAVPLLWFSATFILAETLYNESLVTYMKVFPYVPWRAQHVFTDSVTSEEERAYILKIYENDEALVQLAANREISLQKQLAAYEHLEKLNPLNEATHAKLMLLGIQLDDPNLVIQQEEWLLSFYSPFDAYKVSSLEPSYLDRLISYANQKAETDPLLASKITGLAYKFEPWRVNEVKTVLLSRPDDYPGAAVANLIHSLPPFQLWAYMTPLDAWSWERMRRAADNDNWEQMLEYTKIILIYTDWDPNSLWAYQSLVFKNRLMNLSAEGEGGSAQRNSLLNTWRESLATIEKFGKVGGTAVDTTGWTEEIDTFAR